MIRPILVVILAASGAKLLGASDAVVIAMLAVAAAVRARYGSEMVVASIASSARKREPITS